MISTISIGVWRALKFVNQSHKIMLLTNKKEIIHLLARSPIRSPELTIITNKNESVIKRRIIRFISFDKDDNTPTSTLTNTMDSFSVQQP